MLSVAQFDKLKVGDVLLFNGKPRIIRDISWHETSWGVRRHVTFSIKRMTYGRIYTVYNYHDIKNVCSLPRKLRDKRHICQAECDQLRASGFDVEKQVQRELNEHPSKSPARTLLKRTAKKLGVET